GYAPSSGSAGGSVSSTGSPSRCASRSSCSFSVSLLRRKRPTSEGSGPHLPEVAVEALRLHGVLPALAGAAFLERGDRTEDARVVHRERRAVGGVRQLDRVAVG